MILMFLFRIAKDIFRIVDQILEIPYRFIDLIFMIIDVPLRHFRHMIDVVLDIAFMPLLPLRLYMNVTGGFIYNIYHNLPLGRIQYSLCDLIIHIPNWEEYSWLKQCTESRLYLIFSFIFKSMHKTMLMIPVLGWAVWAGMLPLYAYLRLWGRWIVICPVRNAEAFMCPSSFPARQARPGLYPMPI